MEYRSVISTPKKQKKTNFFHTTSVVPPEQDFRTGDFVILKDDQGNQDQAPVWRFDNKTLLQRFNTGKIRIIVINFFSQKDFSNYIFLIFQPAKMRMETLCINRPIYFLDTLLPIVIVMYLLLSNLYPVRVTQPL